MICFKLITTGKAAHSWMVWDGKEHLQVRGTSFWSTHPRIYKVVRKQASSLRTELLGQIWKGKLGSALTLSNP